jgi:Fe(3+) dicitrate transport protein
MRKLLGAALVTGMGVTGPVTVSAQDAPPAGTAAPAAEPAPAGESQSQIPEVEILQKEPPAPQPQVQKPKPQPQPQQQAAPAPASQPADVPPPADDFADVEPVEAAPVGNNPVYGSPAARGAAARAAQSATTPVNPTQLIPTNLDGFSSAATNLPPEILQENQPRNINEALTRVPGVIVINDDAAAHHGGIGMRGSPARRSRKMLIMENGHANNLALWLDPSVHFWAPIERLESIEVLRGTVITHGPNNNFGVINGRSLSPFGPAETVISSAIGFTRTDRGSFTEIEEVDEDGNIVLSDETRSRKSETDISWRWHVHTR